MSRMRVHELAKALEEDSKEIINILKEQGIEKKAQSALEENEVVLVKNALGVAVEESKNDNEEKAEEKKNISTVHNPQNSQTLKNDKKNEKSQKNNNPTYAKNNNVTKEEKQSKEPAKNNKQENKKNKNSSKGKKRRNCGS